MHTKCCETLIDIITPNTYIHTYIPNVVRLLLIFCASLSLSPVAPVLPTFSEPT